MNLKTKLVVGAVAFCALLLAGVAPAHAESITLSLNGTSQGTFSCTGTNGCFGNDITLDVSGAGTNWTVTLSINTTGNTNGGSGIGAASFILTGFSFSSTDVNLTLAPGGAGGWAEQEGPANANGCQDSTSNSICAEDASAILNGIGLDASPLGGPTYTWVWTITNQTFGGFDASTHVQFLFGDLSQNCGSAEPPCFKGTGLISSTTGRVPEPSTITLLSLGLLGVGAAVRRRMTN